MRHMLDALFNYFYNAEYIWNIRFNDKIKCLPDIRDISVPYTMFSWQRFSHCY